MSVILEGYDKPSSCDECDFLDDDLRCMFFTAGPETRGIYLDCPLVEVPANHGRLLDESRIHEAVKSCRDLFLNKGTPESLCAARGLNRLGMLIEAMPAAVEAEV